MDMELNLLIGGPGGPEGLPNPMHGVQDDPVYRTLRGAVNARTTLLAGFTTVRNLGLMVKTGGYLLDVALQRAIDQGWHDGPAHLSGRARGHAVRRAPRSHGVPAAGAGHHAAERRRGHRQRRRRRARVRALPDPPRRQGDQGLGVGRRDVAQHRAGLAAVLRRGVRGDRRRGAPRRRPGGRARRRRHRDPGVHPGRHRLHRARLPRHRRDDPDDGRPRHVPGLDHLPHRGDGHRPHRTRAAEEGGRGVPAGAGDAAQGDRGGCQDRLRHRRAGDPARPERQGAVRPGRPRHDADAGPAGRDGHQRRAHRGRRRTRAVSRPATSPTSSRFPAIRRGTSPPRSTCGS